MKKFYILIVAIVCSVALQAQTTVNFTEAEGYVQGPLEASADWGGANWLVYPAAGTERAETTGGYSWARWAEPFVVSGTEITFDVHFKFNVDIPAGKLVSRFGFNDSGANSGNIANIQLSTLNDGILTVRAQNNVPVSSGNAALVDFQQDDLIISIVLTLGADAASSTISAKLVNVTDDITSEIAVVEGISAAVFGAATTGGISGFIHAQDNVNGTRGFLVDRVVMTQGNTLSVKSYARPTFSLSQNPVKDMVQLTGLDKGSHISIYSITGAKASSHTYDGSSLNLSYLNAGVYFLQTPGFAAKKLLKK